MDLKKEIDHLKDEMQSTTIQLRNKETEKKVRLPIHSSFTTYDLILQEMENILNMLKNRWVEVDKEKREKESEVR